ncbi:hypothetical protein [Atopobacter phocae]|nr:hypothetical protein [Atopobacter phocae]
MEIAILYCIFGLWIVAFSEDNVWKEKEKTYNNVIELLRDTTRF